MDGLPSYKLFKYKKTKGENEDEKTSETENHDQGIA